MYTGVDRTRNRAVSEGTLALVVLLDTGDDAAVTLARDMVMFSYAMRGMPFVDMAYLRKSHPGTAQSIILRPLLFGLQSPDDFA